VTRTLTAQCSASSNVEGDEPLSVQSSTLYFILVTNVRLLFWFSRIKIGGNRCD
jgi:hypothetical protein